MKSSKGFETVSNLIWIIEKMSMDIKVLYWAVKTPMFHDLPETYHRFSITFLFS